MQNYLKTVADKNRIPLESFQQNLCQVVREHYMQEMSAFELVAHAVARTKGKSAF